MSDPKFVLIYGGCSDLGAECVRYFKQKGHKVHCIDTETNKKADVSLIITADHLTGEEELPFEEPIAKALNCNKYDAIFCLSDAFAGGNANINLLKCAQQMWQKNVTSSIICATLAVKFLRKNGLIVFSGNRYGFTGTPKMMGFGLAKAAVLHLTRSLAEKYSGLPKGCTVLTLCAVDLDSPRSRKIQPHADKSRQTPMDFVTKMLAEWTSCRESRPRSGNFIVLKTREGKTALTIMHEYYSDKLVETETISGAYE